MNAFAEEDFSRRHLRGLARGCGGAIIFSLPLLMTMEMWSLGFYLDRGKLLLFMFLSLLLLFPLSRLVGFERTGSWSEDIVDAFVAFGIGAVTSAIVLVVLGIVTDDMSAGEIVGKIAVQTIPASLGAILTRGQFGSGNSDTEEKERAWGYPGQMLIMAAGALFLAFNVAPTEEMILIAFKMSALHALALMILSIGILHAFVYAVDFQGEESLPSAYGSKVRGVVNFSIAGYALALVLSLYVLWTFGRTDGASAWEIAKMVTVLGFPAALGAAAARLII